jgi:hypothetical protein
MGLCGSRSVNKTQLLIDKYQINDSDIKKIYRVFHKILQNSKQSDEESSEFSSPLNSSATIGLSEFRHYFGLLPSLFVDRLWSIMEREDDLSFNFAEFAELITIICLLDRPGLVLFGFSSFSRNTHNEIEFSDLREQLNELSALYPDILPDEAVEALKSSAKTIGKSHLKIPANLFSLLVLDYPPLLSALADLQSIIQIKTKGKVEWETLRRKLNTNSKYITEEITQIVADKKNFLAKHGEREKALRMNKAGRSNDNKSLFPGASSRNLLTLNSSEHKETSSNASREKSMTSKRIIRELAALGPENSQDQSIAANLATTTSNQGQYNLRRRASLPITPTLQPASLLPSLPPAISPTNHTASHSGENKKPLKGIMKNRIGSLQSQRHASSASNGATNSVNSFRNRTESAPAPHLGYANEGISSEIQEKEVYSAKSTDSAAELPAEKQEKAQSGPVEVIAVETRRLNRQRGKSLINLFSSSLEAKEIKQAAAEETANNNYNSATTTTNTNYNSNIARDPSQVRSLRHNSTAGKSNPSQNHPNPVDIDPHDSAGGKLNGRSSVLASLNMTIGGGSGSDDNQSPSEAALNRSKHRAELNRKGTLHSGHSPVTPLSASSSHSHGKNNSNPISPVEKNSALANTANSTNNNISPSNNYNNNNNNNNNNNTSAVLNGSSSLSNSSDRRRSSALSSAANKYIGFEQSSRADETLVKSSNKRGSVDKDAVQGGRASLVLNNKLYNNNPQHNNDSNDPIESVKSRRSSQHHHRKRSKDEQNNKEHRTSRSRKSSERERKSKDYSAQSEIDSLTALMQQGMFNQYYPNPMAVLQQPVVPPSFVPVNRHGSLSYQPIMAANMNPAAYNVYGATAPVRSVGLQNAYINPALNPLNGQINMNLYSNPMQSNMNIYSPQHQQHRPNAYR